MSLKDVYQRFLAAPNPASLASDVSLIYITSTTEFKGADSVTKHLTKQQEIKINSQTIIDSVQGSNALSLDVDTSLQFLTGGGAYLPNLDETFLFDRVVKFPTIHIVRFNAQTQIQSVRIHWDQASLLKQVEVIGNRARNWPVRDADKQTRLIKVASSSAPADNGPPPVAQTEPSFTAKEGQDDAPAAPPSPGKKRIKDPYAADSLFELLSPSKNREQHVQPPRAPASAKPPPRNYNELFVGDEENDDAPDATPSRPPAVAPKVGAGKNFGPSRIFDDDETVAREKPEQIAYRAHPKRFEHFELGGDNSSREIKAPASRPGSRHVNNWDFEDFSTPQKPQRKPRGEEVRHFGWSDDEPEQDSPPAKPRVLQPRRDAETHFQITDGDEEQGNKRIIKSYQNKGLGLYKNTLYGEADEVEAEEDTKKQTSKERPLSVVHNGPNRKKDFEPHWEVTDEPQETEGDVSHENKKPSEDRVKAVKMMEPSWNPYGSRTPEPNKAATPPQRRVLHNVNQKSWGFGEEE
ncbi:hypothetical protein ASPVEDRAFT_126265 [Aspergillus versicolor CBS 583.65]|uniref:NTF2 domain-containing protein n=1 Tax=Aspergillus versicolor CBS 583.65 TaxID=1036611 RepID=A0A1L9P8R7_ASPVE|nr:uncharacterized protein ASPVEDRAFT_126265 [Aspergillus versicolor CBS 583.65]OJI97863.1 hypothetical protein ASPVEDRAFT_126265 [Aspergillus versicolor CBS 583.65]